MSGASLRVISPLLCIIMMEREKIEREREELRYKVLERIHRPSDRDETDTGMYPVKQLVP